MIKLLNSYNHKGDIIAAGTVLNLGDIEKKLIKNGNAEIHVPKKEENEGKPDVDLSKMTKNELIELAKAKGIEDITDKLNKEEIITRIEDYE